MADQILNLIISWDTLSDVHEYHSNLMPPTDVELIFVAYFPFWQKYQCLEGLEILDIERY